MEIIKEILTILLSNSNKKIKKWLSAISISMLLWKLYEYIKEKYIEKRVVYSYTGYNSTHTIEIISNYITNYHNDSVLDLDRSIVIQSKLIYIIYKDWKFTLKADYQELGSPNGRQINYIFEGIDYETSKKFISSMENKDNKSIYHIHEYATKKQTWDTSPVIVSIKNDKNLFIDKNIIKYFDQFMDNIDNMIKHGNYPVKTVIFYGLPGTGKSATVDLLVKKYDIKRVFNINLNIFDNEYSNNIKEMFNNINHTIAYDCNMTHMLIMDEFDKSKIFDEDGEIFNALISELGNYKYNHPRIIIIICNDIEKVKKLPPVFFRAGRIDKMFEFTYATDDQIRSIIALDTEKQYEYEIKKDLKITPAELRGIIYDCNNDHTKIHENLEKYHSSILEKK